MVTLPEITILLARDGSEYIEYIPDGLLLISRIDFVRGIYLFLSHKPFRKTKKLVSATGH
jgi:hypothetical protein